MEDVESAGVGWIDDVCAENELAGGVEMVGQESCLLTQWFAYVCAGEQLIEAVSGTVDGL